MNDSRGADSNLFTVPNAVSVGRLLGLPVFVWVVVGLDAPVAGFVLLLLAGLSDWLDGHLARALGQRSRLGELLDPLADRLYILVVVLVLASQGQVPWWVAAVVIARDAMLWGLVPLLRTRGRSSLPVHFVGKAATFTLLCAFPLMLLTGQPGAIGSLAEVLGWAFAVWGMGLYWWAGLIYVWQLQSLVQQVPPERRTRVKVS